MSLSDSREEDGRSFPFAPGNEKIQPELVPQARCPHLSEVTRVEELLPYFESVARRPYSPGLWPAWDLKKGERVLLRVTNWHDPLVVEAARLTFEKFGVEYTIEVEEKGPIPAWQGHDEVEYYLARTPELARWIDEWEELDKAGAYDKIIMGYGGPILRDRHVKIQRFPFITREMVASPAHLFPAELLIAIDEWTWAAVREARTVRITDPEGTDLRFTNHHAYWDESRSVYSREHVEKSYSSNVAYGETYLPGHIWGRPHFHIPEEDGTGVIAGTMNHIAPYPRMELRIEKSKIVEIVGGGEFGEKLRQVMAANAHVQYPGFGTTGLMQWWEASIGTNPKVHRPRAGYAQGYNCGLYERTRSGIIHIGFGTVISADTERQAAREGLTVGHWHVHLNYPTYVAEGTPHGDRVVIENGRLKALDDPAIRAIAAKYGDPDELLREDWIPAVPGLNLPGDYDRDFASDPMDFTMTELDICRKWHPLFMRMISGDGSPSCHG
ncbi:hypothetical protein Aple_002420 [Acrocarpospora pleiomorpha]|uniref:Uncharacterized protein n=1 Tax=Acrocarpospora pleiomorpha TaxID=90975 RepID=A0A5M3X6N0_9ACTN|nr:hypothetical protein [Acrocarpospora pleiomorpha]GES17347.1 hypothetical protein Aple_002420 [Acrocarpospora pleiomorpha]